MIELRRDKSRIRVSFTLWTMTVELARLCGWNPAGTRALAPSGGTVTDQLRDVRHLLPWQMEYLSGDGQTVTQDDATQLAAGLTKAGVEGERILTDWIEGRMEPPAGTRTPSTGFKWFSTTEGKTHLQEIAEFCRGGAFQIF